VPQARLAVSLAHASAALVGLVQLGGNDTWSCGQPRPAADEPRAPGQSAGPLRLLGSGIPAPPQSAPGMQKAGDKNAEDTGHVTQVAYAIL
jgi:hypothetical protein